MMLSAQNSVLPLSTCRQTALPARTVVRHNIGRQGSSQLRQQRQQQPTRLSAHRHIVCAAEAAEVGRLISKVEIPSFIPRQDLMDQLTRWAYGNAQDEGPANFGLPMRVNPQHNEEGAACGFVVEIVRGGATLTSIGVGLDAEVTEKYEWVGRREDGFPEMGGKITQVTGRCLTIRKLDDNKVDEELRSTIRLFCEGLNAGVNKYYAFGSCFAEDST